MKRIMRVNLIWVAIFMLTFIFSEAYAMPLEDDSSKQKECGFAESGFREDRGGFYGKGKGVIQKLNLTPEQEKLLQEHRREHKEKMKALSKKLREKRMELCNELEREKVDAEKITSLVKELKPLLGKQLEFKVQGILAMKKILTPEQFEILQSCKKKGFYKGRHKGRMQGGMEYHKRWCSGFEGQERKEQESGD